MIDKAIEFLRNNISCSLGIIDDLSILYTQRKENKVDLIDVIPNMLVKRYWLKEEFSLDRMVFSFCLSAYSNDASEIQDDKVTYFFNILVKDILDTAKGCYSSNLKHNSVEVTYTRLIKACPNLLPTDCGKGLSLKVYTDFLNDLVHNFESITDMGFTELGKIAEESFEGLDKNNLNITVNVLNNLGFDMPYFNKIYAPNITFTPPNHRRDGNDALLKCICLDTEFIPVPLVHLLKFEDNYIELGSIIATKWVNDCVNIYTSDDGLLTTREAVFYACCILVDMFLSFSYEFRKIK